MGSKIRGSHSGGGGAGLQHGLNLLTPWASGSSLGRLPLRFAVRYMQSTKLSGRGRLTAPRPHLASPLQFGGGNSGGIVRLPPN